VDTADLAFWHKPGRLSDLVVDNAQPTGAWWLYKWYGDMTGSMVRTTPPSDTGRGLDGFASLDPGAKTARVVVGGALGGDALVKVNGLKSVRDFGPAARVQVWSAPWTGTDGAQGQPTAEFEGTYPVRDGSISVPLSDTDSNSAYLILVSPSGVGAPQPPSRYEAEAAHLTGARIVSSDQASGNRYAVAVGGRGAAAGFDVLADQAGPYLLDIRHANPTAPDSLRVSVDGGASQTLALRSQHIGQFATTTTTIALHAGLNKVSVTQTGGVFAVDHIDVRLFSTHVEAESGTVTNGRVVAENMADSNLFANRYSGDRYVAFLTEPTSALDVPITVPAAGMYRLTIGYSNGTGVESTDTLSVNDAVRGEVHFVPTQFWGLIRRVSVDVPLRAGQNSVRLAKGTSLADLDYLDLSYQSG
jgi:hypothetical protein